MFKTPGCSHPSAGPLIIWVGTRASRWRSSHDRLLSDRSDLMWFSAVYFHFLNLTPKRWLRRVFVAEHYEFAFVRRYDIIILLLSLPFTAAFTDIRNQHLSLVFLGTCGFYLTFISPPPRRYSSFPHLPASLCVWVYVRVVYIVIYNSCFRVFP